MALSVLLRLFLWEKLEHVKGKGNGAGCIGQETFEQGITGGQGIGQVCKSAREKSEQVCGPCV